MFSQGGANCSYLAMFKALLLPNCISGQPQYFRDASNFTKYWKKNIIDIVTFKGHEPLSSLFLALTTNFWNISNLATVLFLDSFRSYLEELLMTKLSLTLENFIANYQKFGRYFGPNLARNEKTRKVGYLCHLGLQWNFALKLFSHIHCVLFFFTYSFCVIQRL